MSVDGIEADACVVTVPVPVLASIEFDPGYRPCSRPRSSGSRTATGEDGARVRAPAGRGVTTDLTFRAAWDPEGASSRRTRPDERPVARLGEPPHPAAARRGRARRDLSGVARALERGETVSWHTDGWSQGTAVAYAPGQVNRFQAALRRPLGRVHFAGEHTDAYAGTMEGAVRSGRRAAEAIARG